MIVKKYEPETRKLRGEKKGPGATALAGKTEKKFTADSEAESAQTDLGARSSHGARNRVARALPAPAGLVRGRSGVATTQVSTSASSAPIEECRKLVTRRYRVGRSRALPVPHQRREAKKEGTLRKRSPSPRGTRRASVLAVYTRGHRTGFRVSLSAPGAPTSDQGGQQSDGQQGQGQGEKGGLKRLAIFSPYHDRTAYVEASQYLIPGWYKASVSDYVDAVKLLCDVDGCPCNHEVRLLAAENLAVITDPGDQVTHMVFADSNWRDMLRRQHRG